MNATQLQRRSIRTQSLVNAVRRDVIFNGDEALARTARAASDGIEHGFKGWDEVWSLSRAAYVETAKCLREALIDMLALDSDVNSLLCGRRFAEILGEEVPYFSHGIYERRIDWRWKGT